MNSDLVGHWNHLKDNVHHFSELVHDKIQKIKSHEISPQDIELGDYHYESHRFDMSPGEEEEETAEEGVKYNYTENSEFARDAQKAPAVGIDSFGEDDSIDPELYREQNAH